jgi:hypothetical protein
MLIATPAMLQAAAVHVYGVRRIWRCCVAAASMRRLSLP